MHGFRLIFHDWKQLILHKHGRIALTFLLLVPLIYVGLFLSGYWNPYGKLDHLPVAVVNLDKGAVLNGKPIQAGQDFVQELAKTNDLDFSFVTADKAAEGMNKGTYYMTITVPETFSSHAATLMDEHPKQAELIYETNAGRNFVASQIGSTAVKEMKAKLQAELTKAYTDGVFANMQQLADGLKSAGSGALTLHEGAETANRGFSKLASGISDTAGGAASLKQGSRTLTASSAELSSGAHQLKQGADKLAGGLSRLAVGQEKLTDSGNTLASGMAKWQNAAKQASQSQQTAEAEGKQLAAALDSYVKAHPDAAQNEELQALVKQADSLSEAEAARSKTAIELASSAAQLAQGQQELNKQSALIADKLKESSACADTLNAGTGQLDSSMNRWSTGMASLNKGIASLADGSLQLTNGAGQLSQGLQQLDSGSGELASKLAAAGTQTAGLHTGAELDRMFAEPVKLTETRLTDVPNYGSGIAPYFMSLGLFVGGIMGANILPLGRRKEGFIHGGHQFINKLGLMLTVGLVQTVILDALMLFAFRVHVQHLPQFLLFSLVTSFTFLSLIYMLLSIFGFVGKFLAVTLLVTQLATCGGTFPGQLMAPAMSAIGSMLPMTYSVQGFQQAVSIGDNTQWAANLWIMLAYLAGSAVISLVFNGLEHRKHNRLQQEQAASAA